MKIVVAFFLLGCTFLFAAEAPKKNEQKNDLPEDTKKTFTAAKTAVQEDRKTTANKNILDKTVEELKKVGKIETFDFNKDGSIDVWLYYKFDPSEDLAKFSQEKKDKLLLRKDMDINFDKKVDVRKQYDSGLIIKEDSDFDFDGRFDLISFFKDGKVILREFDFNGDGKAEVFKYFKDNQMILKEIDTNYDTKIDTWVYFMNEKILKIAQDVNGDGTPDKWTK